jgi:hypothetical protein
VSRYLKSRRIKERVPDDRLAFGAKLVADGYPVADAARMAKVSPGRLRRALGPDRKLQEGADVDNNDFEGAVARRAAELKQQAETRDYEQAARAELLDRQGPQWEATGGVELNAMGQLRQRQRDQGLPSGVDPDYTATAARVKDYAREHGLTEHEAEAVMFDKGEIR